jgi:hypothetical protein
VDAYLKSGHSGRDALKYVGGVQFTVLCIIMLASTLVPRGALSLNPRSIDGSGDEQSDVERASEEDAQNEFKKRGAPTDVSSGSEDGEKMARNGY